MAVATKVRNTILLPGGVPATRRWNVKVRAQLVNGGFDLDSAFVGSNAVPETLGYWNGEVDPTGHWEITLPPNEQIQPPGTYFRIEERVGTVPKVYNIIVPGETEVTAISRTSNVVTATVPVGHRIEVGDVITVNVSDGSFGGVFTVTAVGATTVQWSQVAANNPSGGTGVLTKDWDVHDLVI